MSCILENWCISLIPTLPRYRFRGLARFELCQAQIGGLQQVQSGLHTLMSTNILVSQAMTTPAICGCGLQDYRHMGRSVTIIYRRTYLWHFLKQHLSSVESDIWVASLVWLDGYWLVTMILTATSLLLLHVQTDRWVWEVRTWACWFHNGNLPNWHPLICLRHSLA